MRLFYFLLTLTLASSSSLVRVNDKNFKEAVINSGKFTLVDFYADWCRHCSNLMPVIESLAETYEPIPEVQIVKINGDEDGRKMTKKYDVPGFPMLMLFNGDNEPVVFEGMRDEQSISNFIQQVSGIRLRDRVKKDETEPSRVLHLNDDTFQGSVFNVDHKTLVALISSNSRELNSVWDELANKIFVHDDETIRFGIVEIDEHSIKLEERYHPEKLPTIFYFDPKKTDMDGLKSPLVYDQDVDIVHLLSFINSNTGLSRNKEGRLSHMGGRIRALDEGLSTITFETVESLIKNVDELQENVSAFGKDFLFNQGELWYQDDISMISYYKKLIERFASGNLKTFIESEIPRLTTILSEHYEIMNKKSLDFMEKRMNILKALADAWQTEA